MILCKQQQKHNIVSQVEKGNLEFHHKSHISFILLVNIAQMQRNIIRKIKYF